MPVSGVARSCRTCCGAWAVPGVQCCYDSVSPAVRAISVVKRRCDCHAVLC